MPENGVYRFGVFELDSRARELKKHGVRIKLQEQPLRILLLLVQHSSEVVTREQIQSELWPAGTYVDYENAINGSVRKLREALGDSPANPRFIETLSRRGYRLLVPVSRNGATEAAPEPSVSTDVASPPGVRRFTWPAVAIGGVLIAAIAVLFIRGRGQVGDVQLPPAVPLTSYPGQSCCPSFSPDGTRVAFGWDGPNRNNFDIYVKLIGPSEPVRLTTDQADDTSPAWSPDGRWIAFLRAEGSYMSLRLIPSLGGSERELARVMGPATQGSNVSWAADGKFVFAVDGPNDFKARWITRVSVESGEKQQITFPDAATHGDRLPAIAPDGATLAFAREAAHDRDDVYSLSLLETPAERRARRITFDDKRIHALAWTGDGRAFIYSSTRGSSSALWRVAAVPHARPALLTGGGEDSRDVAISPQGRLVYSRVISNANVWRTSIGPDAGAPVPLLTSTRNQIHPEYSPDGKRIAFGSDRSGNHEIWVSNADGSAPVQLSSLGAWSGSPRWSPDGGTIAFDADIGGNWDIYIINSNGGKPVRMTTNPANDYAPSWSRDGKWIYFTSTRTPRREVWRIPAARGHEVQVTKNGGTVTSEAPGGRELYFTKARNSGVWKMALPDGPEEQVVSGAVLERNFAPVTRGLYFIPQSGVTPTLCFFEYRSRKTTSLVPLGNSVSNALSISPDERFALFVRIDVANSELMLVEDFGRKP
jgi:Tol biopolymer transport system component/DNA-binding winged helix-turn-helix (wHTH) protein